MINFMVSVVTALSVLVLIGLAMGMVVYNRSAKEKGGRKS
jgi:hypothetical protein